MFLRYASLKLMPRFGTLFRYASVAQFRRKPNGFIQKPEGFFHRALALYIPKFPNNGTASLMDFLELHLGLP